MAIVKLYYPINDSSFLILHRNPLRCPFLYEVFAPVFIAPQIQNNATVIIGVTQEILNILVLKKHNSTVFCETNGVTKL